MKSKSHSLRIVPAVFALCCVVCAAQDQSPPKAIQPKQSQPFGQEASPAASPYEHSEAELRKRASESPASPDVLYELALTLRLEGKYSESLQMYTRAAALQKPSAPQLHSVALDYVLLNDYDDAIRWLRVALGMDPTNTEILYSLGRCLYTQNDLPKAEAAFTRLLQLQPDHLKAEENLGLTYDGENKSGAAEKALHTAAEWADKRQVKDEWPYLDYGTFLLDHGRAAEALPVLDKAAGMAPTSGLAHERLGRALLETGKPADAVTELEKAVGLDANNPKVHFELGRAYRAVGQGEKARAEFDLSKSLYGTRSKE